MNLGGFDGEDLTHIRDGIARFNLAEAVSSCGEDKTIAAGLAGILMRDELMAVKGVESLVKGYNDIRQSLTFLLHLLEEAR